MQNSTPPSSALDAGIADPGGLFRLSTMTDSLRDTAKLLLAASEADELTVGRMTNRYGKLRDAVAAALADEQSRELLAWTPELTAEDRIGGVVDATVMMSAYVDALLQTPAFLVSRRMQIAKIEAAQRDLDSERQGEPAGAERHAAGQYL